jgi:hypothetical protein
MGGNTFTNTIPGASPSGSNVQTVIVSTGSDGLVYDVSYFDSQTGELIDGGASFLPQDTLGDYLQNNPIISNGKRP